MSTAGATLLLVDDEQDIRTVARLTLEQLGGFTVIEAASGLEAIDAATRFHPDAIILDVMMPGMDGPQVFEVLRANPATATLPVLFLTAKAMPAELDRLRALGARAIITKPFDPATLSDEVSAALRHETPAGHQPEPPPAAASDSAIEVDLDALERLRGLTTETGGVLADELIELFATSTDDAVGRLRRLAGDLAGSREFERTAHSLKGSASTVGATTIADLARDIEERSRSGHTSGFGPAIDAIAAALPATLGRLRAARGPAPGAA